MSRTRDNKIKVVNFIIIFVLAALALRLFQLQVLQGTFFKTQAQQNRMRVISLPAPRGKIIDRRGEVMANNRYAYSVAVIPEDLPHENSDEKLILLADILNLDSDYIKSILTQKKELPHYRPFESVIIKRDIDTKTLVMLEERKLELPGVIIEKSPVRDYLIGDIGAHVLGYVGEISYEELQKGAFPGYTGGNIVGKQGLELAYEEILSGEDGLRYVEVNAHGRPVGVLSEDSAQAGYDLVLNLDQELQISAAEIMRYEMLKQQKRAEQEEDMASPTGGALVVMDPNNGQVLSMISEPGYNPNTISKDWNRLSQDSDKFLLNRTISDPLPAGSVFKVATAAAALEELEIDSSTSFYDPGFFKLQGYRFNCWKEEGHGELDFVEALAYSCNVSFYKMAHQLSEKEDELIQHYARLLGMGEKTGIELLEENAGLVPDREWRRRSFHNPSDRIWFPGYTINLSIGQGNLQVTPLQIAVMISAVANGEGVYTPQLVKQVLDPQGNVVKTKTPEMVREFELSEESLDLLQQALRSVVSMEGGTAYSAFIDLSIPAAGKTGTAEGSGNSSHAWFAGYAPFDEPEIAVVVMLENAGSGRMAAEVVKRIMDYYFNRL